MNNNHDIGFLLPKKIINLTFILFMRVFILVLYLGLTSIYANVAKAQNEISVKVQGVSLQSLFTTIQQKSDFVFFYNDDLMSSTKKVSINQYGTVEQILNTALSNTGLAYTIIDKQIVIKKYNHKTSLSELEPYEVKGTVTDKKGNRLVGVNVLLVGTQIWDITREKGDYRIEVVATDSLRFSYLGYKTKTLAVNNKKLINVVLEPQIEVLKDLVVVASNGYTDIPKERVTGAFEVMGAKELAEVPTVDIASRIEGKMAGVKVDPRTGSISVRGTNNYGGTGSPLIVIDGFPQSENDFKFSRRSVPGSSILSYLNPDDVESITVLKDAAAASIWGSRAANGVVVIVTKKGKKGDPTINFSTTTTIGERMDLGKLRVMNSSQYIDYEKDLVSGGFIVDNINNTIDSGGAKNPSAAQEIIFQQQRGTISMAQRDQLLTQLGQNNNLDQINRYLLRNSVTTQYDLSVTGGSDKSSYYLSLGYNKDEAAMRGNESKSYNITLNNSFQLKSFLKLNTGMNYVSSTFQENNTVNEALSNVSSTALRPYDMIADESGNGIDRYIIFRPEVAQGFEKKGYLPWTYNYLDQLNYSNVITKGANLRLNASLTATVNSWLNFEASGMYTSIGNKTRTLNEADSYFSRNMINEATSISTAGKLVYGIPVGAYLNNTISSNDSQSMRFQMNINKNFNENNGVHFLAGSEIREERREASSQRYYGYNTDTNSSQSVNPTTYYTTIYGWQTFIGTADNSISKYRDRYLSYYGLGSYDYMNKYHASGSVRFDDYNLLGASRKNRALPLWSVGGKWDINKEFFLRDISWLNNLSGRITYGKAGSAPSGGFGSNSAIISVGTVDFNTQLPVASISLPENPEIKWETTATLNYGLDYALFDNRLHGSVDLYYKKSKDILANVPYNPTYGWSYLNYNTASLKGHGLDLSIGGLIVNKAFKWNSNFNFSYNTNEVTDTRYNLTTTNQYLAGSAMLGQTIGYVYAYKWAGLDATGQSTVAKKDGTIINSTQGIALIDKEDLKYMGTSIAPYFGGLMNSFSYSNFTLGVQVSYYMGSVFRNPVLQNYPTYVGVQGGAVAKDELIADRWRAAGDETTTNVPGLSNISYNSVNRFQMADINVLPADNIRLQQVSLSYNVPSNFLDRTFIKSLSFNFAARNLGLLWVKNDLGIDPQYLSTNNYNTLAPQRNYTLQFNCSF
ncbi:SusC/RagA family TonB-linked outer membrane protein [Flavobacterium sp. ov086]|uniref:SusC/RagA family TonB-linked outer membrane protein n=1 Tax=Flavobacterium sp. ov086 TaxID=1761785 RepID=UPI000B734F9D|nr:SusC/RagA family TonB-linked outer membrane protein [Flavobacterium sp. ov086]SNR41910.1 TonB-linked outer membrane protein, SusC/RagA family [Flavobacterium sp. ov086]